MCDFFLGRSFSLDFLTWHIVDHSFEPQTTNLNYQVYSPTSLPIVGDEIMSSPVMSSPQIIINWDEPEKVLEHRLFCPETFIRVSIWYNPRQLAGK